LTILSQALGFGLAVFFILLGLAGVIIPMIPGTLLIWLSVGAYALLERANDLAAIDPLTFAVITVIALVTGTADLWLPLLGAKASGSSRRALVFGVVGALLGTFLIPIPLLGTVIGYAAGVLLGEYHKHRDWDRAVRAGAGGLAGWGIATILQLGGGLLILLIFVWQVLAYAG
jgi:uncharacterized protein YqgC (DUF456 family)